MRKIFYLGFTFLLLSSCGSKDGVKPIIEDIQELVFASGEIQWDNSYNLTAQTEGVLSNANFEVGMKITQGTVLAIVDNKSSGINTETAQEQLSIANENLSIKSPQQQQLRENISFAEKKYEQDKNQTERYKKLYESGSVSKLEYENVLLNSQNSLSNLNALKKQNLLLQQQAKQVQINSKSQVENNKLMLKYNQIIATENGTVIKKMKEAGDFVRKGDVIATIANENEVEAVLNLDENSIGKIKLGQEVYIQLNTDKNTNYLGNISEILPAFDEKSQSYICKVKFKNELKSSIFGTQLQANILIGEKKNALLIPREYMGFGNKVNVKGKNENIIIKPGIISTEYVEVLEGISKNDIILPLKP